MADQNTQVSAGTQTGWEAEKQKLESELNSLRGSVQGLTKYKNRAEAWDRLAQDPRAKGAIKYGPDGMPQDWEVNETRQTNGQAPGYAQMVNPWQDLGIDANQANAWYQQNFQALASQQGFVTQAQADVLATQKAQLAYQAADRRFSTIRSVDKLLSNPIYKELSDSNSDWSKRTANYLQQFQAGKPNREGASWDEWDYTAPQVLQQAADITYAQMVREKESSQTSQNQAIQKQNAGGLADAFPGVSAQTNPVEQFDKIAAQGGDPLLLLRDVVNKSEAAKQAAM